NYYSKEELNDILGTGEYNEDGGKDGFWSYRLKTNANIKYYEGNYIDGLREGVWKNYSVTLPSNHANNDGLIRSWEVWKGGKLYKWKGGANYIELEFENGVNMETADEFRRLDEAFENMYRSTKGDNFNYLRSESIASLAKMLCKRMKETYLQTDAIGNLTFNTAGNDIDEYEEFNNGKITKGIYFEFEGTTCYSKQVYENDTLREKYLYMLGVESDVDMYTYHRNGYLKEIQRYRGDSVKFGKWMGYYSDGSKKYIGSYLHGKKSGKWKFWGQDGEKNFVSFIDGVEVK
ncbi:hypothetical protein ACFLRY_01950, partial [Bacteroidota bacterium]